jgi:APA family basic amino acid/polyamine antiporter
VFFARMAQLHPRTRTPVWALVGQGAVALALLFTGTYGQLLDYVVFADWIFFGATAASLFVFRARDAARGTDDAAVRSPLHPWGTVLFVLAAGYVVLGAIVSNPGNALRGAAILAAGVPVHAFWRRRAREGA